MVREADVAKPASEPASGFSWRARGRSFGHALRGLAALLASQHNARIHIAIMLAVVGLGLVLGLGNLEWALLALAIGLVWAAECANTALEWLCDLVSPEYHPLVKKAKDVAAGGVLLAAISAAVAGLFVLLPHFFS